MTPTLSPQQREEVLEAMARAAASTVGFDYDTLHPNSKAVYRRIAAAALDAALPAIIGAVYVDDPDLDATDGAHPAWWRGHYHTADQFGRLVLSWLDGTAPEGGTMGEPWETIRRRIRALAEEAR